MAHGGKVNTNPSRAPAHYTPDTGLHVPYTREHANLADMVLIWLSGFAIGLTVALIATGN
jgi:hypothetical protein